MQVKVIIDVSSLGEVIINMVMRYYRVVESIFID